MIYLRGNYGLSTLTEVYYFRKLWNFRKVTYNQTMQFGVQEPQSEGPTCP